jgi:hypothetical protein
MANVYSSSRPLHGSNGAQTKMHEEMAEYAYSQVNDPAMCYKQRPYWIFSARIEP